MSLVWFFDFANNHQFQLFKILEMVFFAEYLESQNLSKSSFFLKNSKWNETSDLGF